MPHYDYHCESCDREFTVSHSITEHTRKDEQREIRCPHCNSQDVKHLIHSVFVVTSKKS
jgi:putative FmdB family regulatory protein